MLAGSGQLKTKTASMGMKFIVVCALALFLTLPALFVNGLVSDRTTRVAQVVREVNAHVGGPQTFLGPTLAIPYTLLQEPETNPKKRGVYFVSPARALAVVKTSTQERRRSLFKVPVFQADLKLDGAFDLSGLAADIPQGAQFDWSHAEVLIGVSDARGALADGTVTIDGKSATLVPAATIQELRLNGDFDQSNNLPADVVRRKGRRRC